MARIHIYTTCTNFGGLSGASYGAENKYFYDTDLKQVVTETKSYNDALGTFCQTYSRSITEKIHHYCEGANRVDIFHDGYGGITQVKVKQGCKVNNPPVLTILNVEVTHQQTEGRGDGAALVTVNRGNVAWTITGVYINEAKYYSLTGVFTIPDLFPGDYTVCVRDVMNHSATSCFDFTVLPKFVNELPSEPKWWFEYKTVDDILTRVEIYGKNWPGAASELDYIGKGDIDYIGVDPFVLEWKGQGNDKYRPVIYSECVLNVIAKLDFQYIDIFSSDETEHLVKVIHGGELFWTGYIIPDVYTEPYLTPPYEMSVSAVDGIYLLKNHDFDLTGEYASYLQIIQYCLAKTGHLLNLKESCFLYPFAVQTGSPLVIQKVKVESLAGLNCLEVLEKILFANLSRLYLQYGVWNIVPIDVLNDIYTERTFNPGGELISEIQVNPLKEIGCRKTGDVAFRDRSQVLSINPAYKEVGVKQSFGVNDQILKNPDFTEDIGIGKNWSGLNAYPVTYRDNRETKEAIAIVNGYIEQTINIEPTANQDTIDFEIEFKVDFDIQPTKQIIHFDFSKAGEKQYIGLVLNGTFYNWLGTLPPPNVNMHFYDWLNTIPDFKNHYIRYKIVDADGKINVVGIQSLEADPFYDYGDVDTGGGILVSGRTNDRDIDLSTSFFRVFVHASNISDTRSLNKSGFWGGFYIYDYSTPDFAPLTTSRELVIPVSKVGEWESFKISSEFLPLGTTSIHIRIYGLRLRNDKEKVPQTQLGTNAIVNIVRKVNIILKPNGDYIPESFTTTVLNPNHENLTFVPDTYQLFLGDLPGLQNDRDVYKNGVYYYDEEKHKLVYGYWHKGMEEETDNRLRSILAVKILEASENPTQVITGSMIPFYRLSLNNSLYDPHNPGRYFVINYMKYHDRSKKYDVELVEMAGGDLNLSLLGAMLLETGAYMKYENDGKMLLE